MPAFALKRRDIPLHRQLDAILRDRIAGGQLRPGDRFPVETDLCAQYGVSRATVRQPPSGRRRIASRDFAARGAARSGTELRFGSQVPPAIMVRALKSTPETETPFFIRVLTTPKACAGA